MAILNFIKAWGPYKPGDILSSHSVPTIKALTETYRVAVMLDKLPVIAKPKPEIVLEPEPKPEAKLEPKPEPETISEDWAQGDDESISVPVLRKRLRKPKPKPE